MNGNTYLTAALITAGVGVFLWVIGPIAQHWHEKLERDLVQLKGKAKRSS